MQFFKLKTFLADKNIGNFYFINSFDLHNETIFIDYIRFKIKNWQRYKIKILISGIEC